jgi:ABC-type transport system involved in multi-copper enzyme maturation permease subunit
MVFATGLVLERDPLRWAELPSAFAGWVQDAGMVAALGLVAYSLGLVIQQRLPGRKSWSGISSLIIFITLADVVLYALFGILLLAQGLGPTGYSSAQKQALTVAGAIALITVSIPPVLNLVQRVRWQRVAALARLSIKEAVRGRVLWVFAVMALVFLFAGYFVSYKEEDQIRNYVVVIFWPLTLLFLALAALLGCVSIPRDVVKQTIHTIVTKPVERYEIVLGRYLGNAALLTVALFALTAAGLVYLARGITPEAEKESYKARIPVEPDTLTFYGTGKEEKGENVGREWDYRTYIRGRTPHGGRGPKQYAIWSFLAVPTALGAGPGKVPCEFTFDIYRTVKAEKGQEGVQCTLTFASGRLQVPEIEARVQAARTERQALLKAGKQDVDDVLIRKYGVFEASGLPVVDYHTGKLPVPASVFAKILEDQQGAPAVASSEEAAPALKVLLSVSEEDRNSAQQLIGVAKRDLYLVAGELRFEQNFFKAAVGLWLLVLLVLGVAVACSTYFSTVISLLVTGFLLVCAGIFRDFIRDLAEGKASGGGPFEASWRLFNSLPIASQLDQTPAASLGLGIDDFFRFVLRFVSKILPDVSRFDLTEYVASGFNISWTQVLLPDNFIPLLGYLVPWAILAFYLMRSREIANPS